MRTSSSISRSSAGPLLVLALAVILSAAFSWHAKRHWQVESAFFSEAIRASERYAETLRADGQNPFIVFGGSTSRTSWIPSVLREEFGVPVVNFGLHAGFGPRVIAELAMREAQPGDTVVVAFEPAILARDETATPTSGVDLFLHEEGLSFRCGRFFQLVPAHFVQYLQGNTRYNLFMLMKHLRGMKPYRYVASENLHDDGWMEVLERRPLTFDPAPRTVRPIRLGAAGRDLLLSIRAECERRGCRAVYALPPRLDGNPNAPAAHSSLILDILPILPVVRDPLLGCNPNPDEFADTPQHPIRPGALRATRSLGAALAGNDFWDVVSLKTGRAPPGDEATPPKALPHPLVPISLPKPVRP